MRIKKYESFVNEKKSNKLIIPQFEKLVQDINIKGYPSGKVITLTISKFNELKEEGLIYTNDNVNEISKYIATPMSATRFYDDNGSTSREIITSEIIYYWMIIYNIPFECQKWHLNRLMVLIRVCSKKNEKPKKMSKAEIINRNRKINNQRRQQLNSNG